MNRRTCIITATIAALTVSVLGTATFAEPQRAPEPHIVPSSWELEIEHATPRVISVQLPGEDERRHYWYMTYTVTNRSGDDQFFVPEFTMITDRGDVLQANQGTPPRVVQIIKNREGNPLLERPTQIIGRLLQGPDNARDGMAVWPMPEHNVRNVRIFIAGLSGEIHTVEDPATGEERRLRKTLMLEYNLPGSERYMPEKRFMRAEPPEWVVR